MWFLYICNWGKFNYKILFTILCLLAAFGTGMGCLMIDGKHWAQHTQTCVKISILSPEQRDLHQPTFLIFTNDLILSWSDQNMHQLHFRRRCIQPTHSSQNRQNPSITYFNLIISLYLDWSFKSELEGRNYSRRII